MTDIDLQAQADALAERARHMARRAREAKKKVAQVQSDRRRSAMDVLTSALVRHLSGLDYVEQGEFLTGIGLSESEIDSILFFITSRPRYTINTDGSV